MPQTESQPATQSQLNAELLLLFVVTVWGVNFVIVKAALSQFQPHVFNSLRFALAIVALLAAMRFKGITVRLFSKATWPLFLAGLLHTTFYQMLFIEGIARTTASNSAMILAATPATVAVIGHLAGTEKISRRTWLGIALAFAGLYLVIRASHRSFTL